METGAFALSLSHSHSHSHNHSIITSCTLNRPPPHFRHSSLTFPRFSITATSSPSSSSSSTSPSLQPERYKGPKPSTNFIANFVTNNDEFTRSLPIYVGAFSLLAVLFNRAFYGIAPVADASSSQSRADLLALGLAVTNILTGLVWLSIRPKSITRVDLEGVDCHRISPNLPDFVTSELEWFWQSISSVTCCKSMVIIYEDSCICQTGVAAESSIDGEAETVDAAKLIQGTLYRGIMKSSAQSYLANLSLYPGRSELTFLPPNTQAVILQPLGNKGIAVIGGDTIRGFSTTDQAWISLIGDKLDATLTKSVT